MSEPPTTWIGLLGVVVLVAGPIIATVVTSKRSKIRADNQTAKIGDQLTEVQDQVVNSHGQLANNLRDDVDRVIRTGDENYTLLIDTHRMIVDNHGRILRLGDQVADHAVHIQKISKDVDGLHAKVDRWEKGDETQKPITQGDET